MHTGKSEVDRMRYHHIKITENAADQRSSSGIRKVCYVLRKVINWNGKLAILFETWKFSGFFWVKEQRGKENTLTKSTDVNGELVNKCRNLKENVGWDFGPPAMIHSTRNLHKLCIQYRVFIQLSNSDIIKQLWYNCFQVFKIGV